MAASWMSFLMGLVSSSIFSAEIHFTACLTLSPSGMIVAMLMLLGLPVMGLVLSGKPLAPYFEFPPRTRYVQPAPFSWTAFAGYALFIVLCVIPFVVRGLRRPDVSEFSSGRPRAFPWWGRLGVVMGICAWILAWSRFPWFQAFQAQTLTPLWLAYILFVNALTFRRTGQCLIIDQPGRFVLLFPASAAFWWFFEYLNRFVQNWQYAGVGFGPLEYFLYATLSFSTVLPAVMSTGNGS
jgi:hypothetical protein